MVGDDRSSDSLGAFADAARHLQDIGTIDDLLQEVVDMAVTALDGCTYAGISTDRNGRPQSPVVSDPEALEIDSLQYSIGEGPCLAAMRGPEAFIDAPDLRHDERFPTFGPSAASKGCASVLAHRLYVDTNVLGSLNLYGAKPHAFATEDRQRSIVLSALVSFAINVIRIEADGYGLRAAIAGRDVIGQAKGILMEREHLGAEEAFGVLRDRSQAQNVKLRDIAQNLVDERQTTAKE